MRLEARVNAVYDQLTANERELVSHILQEKQQVRGMNSTQLAQHLHVSRTTLVRFWKKLGVQSYAEFRLLLQQDQRELDAPGVELGAIVRMYHAMIDELPKLPYGRVCRLLRAAPTIYIYGTGNEQKAIAEEFKRIFLLLGKCLLIGGKFAHAGHGDVFAVFIFGATVAHTYYKYGDIRKACFQVFDYLDKRDGVV